MMTRSFVWPRLARGCHARKNHLEFGEFAGASIDLDRSGVLLDDNVVAQREAKTGSFAGGLGRKERIEYLLPYLGKNTDTIVAHPDLDAVTETSGRDHQRRLVAVNPDFPPALHRRIGTIRNQIQKDARNLLRTQIDHSGRRIKGSLQLDVELLLLRSRAVVRKIEAVFNDGVDLHRAAFARSFTRMQQHVLDDGVGTLPVLDHLLEISLQHLRQFVELLPR